MEKGLRRRLGPDFDDYCFPMDDRLGRRLGPDFDDYCFPMDDRVHDGSGWTAEQRAEAWISMEKGLRRRLRPDFDDYCFPMARQARDDRMHDCSGWAAEQLAGPRKTQMMAKPLSRVSIFLQD